MYDFLLLLNLVVWGALTFYYLRLPCASAFHPASFYLFFHFLIFVFRPFFVWYRDYGFIYKVYQFNPSMDDKITVQLASMLGLVCFVLLSIKFGDAPPRFPQDRIHEAERKEMIRPYLFVAAVFVPLGVISILANWGVRANDANTMVMDAATGHSINTTGNGYFDNLQLFLAPLSVMCVWLYRFRWWSFLPLLAFVVLRAGTGGRWAFVMACATVGLLFLYQNRQRWPNLRATAIGAAGLVLFQLVGADRGASIRRLFVEDNSYEGTFGDRQEGLQFLEGMDFGNLEFFEYIVYAVPQRTGTYGYFLDNLQLLTQPIPRVLWEGKPIGPPIQLFSLFDYGFPIGMTYSLPGNGWMQLGYLGVAIWCALFGWLFGVIYNRFQRSEHGNPAVLAYLLFIPISVQFFRDGLLLSLVQFSAFFVVPVWMVVRFAKLAAVPLADDLRMQAFRRAIRRQPQIAQKILARRNQGRGRARRQSWPAE